ncbi:MAG: proton-conducting membrane transporter [Phycisphaeraceae bacterium]|nr:proton-conducting membrane transporter [Phycisphaeraceae bacterium]
MTPGIDLQFVDQVIARHGQDPEFVLPILEALQEHYRYLPEPALRRVCAVTRITPASIVGVSTFYDHFRRDPAGRRRVRVCCGTACHVKGAELIHQAIAHHCGVPPGQDTDPQRRYTIERVACLGCCTLAPVVQVDDVTYGQLTPDGVRPRLAEHERRQRGRAGETRRAPVAGRSGLGGGEVRIGLGSCCAAKGSDRIYETLLDAAAEFDLPVTVQRVGCVGMCHRTPLVEVRPAARGTSNDDQQFLYERVRPDEATSILERHFAPKGFARWRRKANHWIEGLLSGDADRADHRRPLDVRDPAVSTFLGPQRHIATEHFGCLDPLDLGQYLQRGGFDALQHAREDPAAQIIDTISRSGLRGRGGAGFPSGEKWRRVARAEGRRKYVICNGDEGDPGAFMDRMLLESFPFRIMEGMAIAAHAIGADEAILFVRHEYALAVRRLREAIAICARRGVFGATPRFEVREGGGAFVCGEETALLASLEGRRGMPRPRPPFPAERGLWDRPTLVNNVETFAVVPWIVRHGAGAFASMGTAGSKGTKVFSLAGRVRRGGLIEVPMGMTIGRIVQEIGGGIADGRRFKAVQIGGPSGGCVPAALADTPVDYEALREVGAMMGSGGLVVLDDTDCMVDLARYFLRFTQGQSCGRCTFCRVGTRRMLEILDRLCEGRGQRRDLQALEQLADAVRRGSLCGLGGTAPNPVLTTLRYFRDEYEAHIDGRCPAGRCKPLIRYEVADGCVGCTLCAQHCPVEAIALTPLARHHIDDVTCTRCDTCRLVCPHEAIEVR